MTVQSKFGDAIAALHCQNQTLTVLDLRSSQIVGAGAAETLADALKVNQTLTKLYLTYNLIGDAGAETLADALKVNRTLTVLYLGSNQIGGAGAETLADALKVN